jgi:LysR family glycine cleavage system transcriptional activator
MAFATALFNISPFGRLQVAEHLDWYEWFAHHDIDLKARSSTAPHFFNANNYNLLIQSALEHQGVALGWHYLVAPLIEKGLLVGPVKERLVHRETLHYMNFNEDKACDPSCCKLQDQGR